MSKSIVKFRRSATIALLMGILVLLAVMPASAANISVFTFASLDSTGCNTGETFFNAVFALADPGLYTVLTTASVGTTLYMNEAAGGFIGPDAYLSTWGLFDNESGGPITGTWPIPADQPVTVTSILVAPDGQYVWESRVVLTKCNSGSIQSQSSGPIYQRAQNGGFETAGTSAQLPLKWTVTEGNDRRVCDSEVETVAHTGDCAFRLKGSGSLSQKWKNIPVAEAGDELRLSAWLQGTGVASGNTITATVKFSTALTETVTLTVPAGDYAYQQVFAPSLLLPDNVTSISLAINKVGSGTLLVDDIVLMVATNVGDGPAVRFEAGGWYPAPGAAAASEGNGIR